MWGSFSFALTHPSFRFQKPSPPFFFPPLLSSSLLLWLILYFVSLPPSVLFFCCHSCSFFFHHFCFIFTAIVIIIIKKIRCCYRFSSWSFLCFYSIFIFVSSLLLLQLFHHLFFFKLIQKYIKLLSKNRGFVNRQKFSHENIEVLLRIIGTIKN